MIEELLSWLAYRFCLGQELLEAARQFRRMVQQPNGEITACDTVRPADLEHRE